VSLQTALSKIFATSASLLSYVMRERQVNFKHSSAFVLEYKWSKIKPDQNILVLREVYKNGEISIGSS